MILKKKKKKKNQNPYNRCFCIKPIYSQMNLNKTSGFKDSLLIMEQKVNPIHVNKCNLDFNIRNSNTLWLKNFGKLKLKHTT